MNENEASTECPNRPECDGCPLFELGDESRAKKHESLVANFHSYRDQYGWQAPEIGAFSPSLGYRNRARMVVTDEGRLGFYKAGSREVVPIDLCPVHDAGLEAVLSHLRTFDGLSDCRFVDLRICPKTGEANVVLVRADEPSEDWCEGAKAHISMLENVSALVEVLESDAIGSGQTRVLSGSPTLTMHVGAHRFRVANDAFFQVNIPVLEAIHERLTPFVAESKTLLDAFCGVGVHGIACAPAGAEIVGFDSVASAVELAVENAAEAGVRATYRVVEDEDFEAEGAFDTIIVNPARAGLAQSFVQTIATTSAGRLAYVSCDAPSFLRDAERLQSAGWTMSKVSGFDMMPRTEHVELLGLFERQESREYEPISHFSGVQGPPADDHWFAVVEGAVPNNATLPRALGSISRLRRCGMDSVVEIRTNGVEAADLRETLRVWRHPVVADPEYGTDATTHRYERDFALDRLALHRYRCVSESGEAEVEVVSAHLVSIFRLPEKILNPSGRGDDV